MLAKSSQKFRKLFSPGYQLTLQVSKLLFGKFLEVGKVILGRSMCTFKCWPGQLLTRVPKVTKSSKSHFRPSYQKFTKVKELLLAKFPKVFKSFQKLKSNFWSSCQKFPNVKKQLLDKLPKVPKKRNFWKFDFRQNVNVGNFWKVGQKLRYVKPESYSFGYLWSVCIDWPCKCAQNVEQTCESGPATRIY